MNSDARSIPISMARRMYDVMAVWQTLPIHDQPSFIADFANIWRAADKVVYSKTLNPLPERVLSDISNPRRFSG